MENEWPKIRGISNFKHCFGVFAFTNSEFFGRPKDLRGAIDLHSYVHLPRRFRQNGVLFLFNTCYFFQTVCKIDTLDYIDVVSKKCLKSAATIKRLPLNKRLSCYALQTLFRHQINTVVQLLLRFLDTFQTPNQYSSAAVATLFGHFFDTKSIQQCSCCCAFWTLFRHQINTVVQLLLRFLDAFSTPNQYRSAAVAALLGRFLNTTQKRNQSANFQRFKSRWKIAHHRPTFFCVKNQWYRN